MRSLQLWTLTYQLPSRLWRLLPTCGRGVRLCTPLPYPDSTMNTTSAAARARASWKQLYTSHDQGGFAKGPRVTLDAACCQLMVMRRQTDKVVENFMLNWILDSDSFQHIWLHGLCTLPSANHKFQTWSYHYWEVVKTVEWLHSFDPDLNFRNKHGNSNSKSHALLYRNRSTRILVYYQHGTLGVNKLQGVPDIS